PALLDGNLIELRGMPVGRDFSLVGRADGYARVSLKFEDLEPGKTTQGTMILKPEAIVTGRMVDNRGEPVPEGRIIPVKSGESRWQSSMDPSAFTEVVDGAFVIRGLSPGDVTLHYSGAGFSAEKMDVPNVRVGERRDGLVWHANKGMSVRGKVVWPDGGPARHIAVKLVGMNRRELSAAMNASGSMGMSSGATAETDADGLFEISGFKSAIQVELMAEGLPEDKKVPRDLSKIQKRRFVRKNTVRARVDKVLVGGPEVTIVLGEEQDPLVGRVQDDQGTPITTFRLIATPIKGKTASQKQSGWGTAKGGVLRLRHQDDEGAFEWKGLPNGDWSIEATASGYQKGEVLAVTTPSKKELVLMLPRGARIFGKVVDQDDDKMLAEVRYTEVIDGVPSDDEESVAATKQFGFSIPNLAPGTYRVYANEPTHGESPSQTFTVAAGEVVDDVILKVPGPGSVEGTVHRDWWEDGLAVKLNLQREGDNNRWSPSKEAKIRADGTFSVSELAPGTYNARLEGNFSVSSGRSLSSNPGPSQTVVVSSGQSAGLHFGGAPPGSVRMKGRLLREDEGVSGYEIDFTGIEPGRDEVETISRAGGNYSVILAGPGTYRVRARPGDGGPRQVWQIEVGSGAQTIDMELPSYSLTMLVGVQGGGSVPFELKSSEFTVEVDGMGGRGAIGASKVEGSEVTFEGLAPGDYRLRFKPRGRGWGRSRDDSLDASHNFVLVESGVVTLRQGDVHKTANADLRRGGTLTGRVTGAPSDPDLWLYVSVSTSENGGSNKWAQVQDGEFRVNGLPEGDVWVTCNGSGRVSGEAKKVAISYDGPAFVELPYPEESDD
ncbi:MAG: carboxypeptidase-like regulatory domain-containing protein, partial [Planctomycetota bacterium]|nr:carboxypeptidase-like regulatory domain-containing protein [Planctomycetota bacterium]